MTVQLPRRAARTAPAGDCAPLDPVPEAARFRRSPREVMTLDRLGAFHPTRLSFLRQLLRRAAREGWRFGRPLFEIDGRGVGRALYAVDTGPCRYCLLAFGHELPPEARTDRVIATRWDATFALVDGMPDRADLDRLAAGVPLQEAGRLTRRELVLSRANRSVRLFDHVVERLAAGGQPDAAQVAATGYLMRTTAVYGSGKFGAADRDLIANRPELKGPFQAEMLTVWLIRAFTLDLVEAMAGARSPAAARLDPALRRRFGVGNSTGLGMAPFLVRHPVLLNNWMMAREEALARVRAVGRADEATRGRLGEALAAARQNAAAWSSDHPRQAARLAGLRRDLDRIGDWLEDGVCAARLFDALYERAVAELSIEGQEALVALLIEPHGDLVDGLGDCMDADEEAAFPIDGSMPLDRLAAILRERYDYALGLDYRRPETVARFWYVSEEKLEPRLGERFEEDGAALEEPLAVGRDAAALAAAIDRFGTGTVAAFLLAHPEHRHAVRRAQVAARHPFAEIRGNLVGAELMPIDLLRCKLSFFGANRFDPRSDRWVRVSLFQDAPHPEEICRGGWAPAGAA